MATHIRVDWNTPNPLLDLNRGDELTEMQRGFWPTWILGALYSDGVIPGWDCFLISREVDGKVSSKQIRDPVSDYHLAFSPEYTGDLITQVNCYFKTVGADPWTPFFPGRCNFTYDGQGRLSSYGWTAI